MLNLFKLENIFLFKILGDFDGTEGRENANGIDLNRNFPDQFGVTKDNEIQQPETSAVMKWILSEPFVLSANLHGGSLVANYPYDDNKENTDGIYSKSPDDALFRRLASVYSNVSPLNSFTLFNFYFSLIFKDHSFKINYEIYCFKVQ